MRRTEALQGVRMAVFLNILNRWELAELNQEEAAELLGVTSGRSGAGRAAMRRRAKRGYWTAGSAKRRDVGSRSTGPRRWSGCWEPSWLENIELRAKKAMKRENIDRNILTFDGFASPPELKTKLSRIGIRTLSAPMLAADPQKVGVTNSQFNWLRQAILSI